MNFSLKLSMSIFLSALFAINCFSVTLASSKSSSAVVVVYHRFNEPAFASTSIRLEQFKAHLSELKKNQYNVVSLPEIVSSINLGKDLPDRTIGLSVDDAYRSFYDVAWPLLKAAKLPVTLFVSTDVVDRQAPGYMTWDQIREVQKEGVIIGSQTKSHKHLPLLPLGDAKMEIDKANIRIATELGKKPSLLAYPYGEYSYPVRQIIVDRGFDAAFTQSSGVISSHLDKFAFPRFALNERYGGIDRFRLIVNAMPMMVTDVLPKDPFLTNNPPAFGFTVDPIVGSLKRLACFASNQGKLSLEQLGRRVEVRLASAFPAGRSRINCTMPGLKERWRWFGVQFTVP